jgi:hypothetical protein
MQCTKSQSYSMTLLARPSSESGNVMPSVFEVLRLSTSSTLTGLQPPPAKINRLLALENSSGVDANLAIHIGNTCSVTQ